MGAVVWSCRECLATRRRQARGDPRIRGGKTGLDPCDTVSCLLSRQSISKFPCCGNKIKAGVSPCQMGLHREGECSRLHSEEREKGGSLCSVRLTTMVE